MATCVPWVFDPACCENWDTLDPDVAERAAELAWATTRVLSGGQLGACAVTVRPCVSTPCTACTLWWQGPWVTATLSGGEWTNCACGTTRCSCVPLCELIMPGPVAAVLNVNVSGSELPLSAVRIDNGNRIVRTDGSCWPSCQDMGAAVGEPGSFAVSYVPGIIPDGAALWAVGVLACEFAKACTGGICRLPASVTTIARQGVTMTLNEGMFSNGLTGIREVDAWLVAVNPYGHRTPPKVWSPDVSWAKHRYTTETAEVTP